MATQQLQNLRVREVMTSHVETLNEMDDVDLADMLMRLDHLRHLPVVAEGSVVGLISHRDILRHQVHPTDDISQGEARRANIGIKVQDVMVRDIQTVGPDTLVSEAAEKMKGLRVGCLPVLEEGELVGILTDSDLMGLLVNILKNPA